MSTKIDVKDIVKDHFKTLNSTDTQSPLIKDYVTFFIFPLIPALILVFKYGIMPTPLTTTLVTSLSITAALLLNLFALTLNTTLNAKPLQLSDKQKLRKQFAKEITSNIAFATLIALTIIVSVLFFGISQPHLTNLYLHIFTGVIYYLCSIFVLKFLMLIKRFYGLLQHEIDNSNS